MPADKENHVLAAISILKEHKEYLEEQGYSGNAEADDAAEYVQGVIDDLNESFGFADDEDDDEE